MDLEATRDCLCLFCCQSTSLKSLSLRRPPKKIVIPPSRGPAMNRNEHAVFLLWRVSFLVDVHVLLSPDYVRAIFL